MRGLILVPVVIIEIASNPAGSWWVPWPRLMAEWQCRPVDFVAIVLHLTRLYGGLSVTAPADLRELAAEQYKHVEPPPLSRLT
jgi:hypothetical protein